MAKIPVVIAPEGSNVDVNTFTFPTKVYELTVRFTTRNDFTSEIGSAGPRDAVLLPLVQIVNDDGLPVACPLLEIDRLRGSEAGGRWILEPSDAKLNASTIRYCVERALEGVARIEAYPFIRLLKITRFLRSELINSARVPMKEIKILRGSISLSRIFKERRSSARH